LEPVLYSNDPFAKTGSGQTLEKLRQKGRSSQQNMSSASPQHRELTPTLSGAYYKTTPGGDGCTLFTAATLPLDAQTEAGAPAEVVVQLTVAGVRALLVAIFIYNDCFTQTGLGQT
jgi:hypothetical protein